MDRLEKRRHFLEKSGWRSGKCQALAADASFRSYYRVQTDNMSVILMDAPPPKELVSPFINVANYLRTIGFSAPKILYANYEDGFVLMEDLGDKKFSDLLFSSENPESIYHRAMDVLCALHEINPPPWLKPYDESVLLTEADLLIDWYFPTLKRNIDVETMRNDYHQAWKEAFSMIDLSPTVTVLRDFHSENLMWLPNRNGASAVGLLDFQDALAGPPAYDVVSLLEDARHEIPQPFVLKSLDYYIEQSQVDPSTFRNAYNTLGAQRNSKIIGIFTRLWKRDHKDRYLEFMPRVWSLLENNLRDPSLQSLCNWFDEYLPTNLRGTPYEQ